MNTNYQTICQHFESVGLNFKPHPEDHVITGGFMLTTTEAKLLVHAPPDGLVISISLGLPVAVPPERRAAVGELLHRLNRTSHLGHFELDYDDGLVRFSISATLPESDFTVSADIFALWLQLGLQTVDGYGPSILKVAYGHLSPAHAAEQGEAHYLQKIQDGDQAED